MFRVLLVDDEVFTRQGLRNLIDWASCGYEVIDEAGNGEDALVSIEKHKPHLVITDIRMPVCDGMELIRLTKEKKLLNISFIIISGFDDFKYAQQAVRFGVHDFILKPIDKPVFEETLIRLHHKFIVEKSASNERELLLHNKNITSLIKGEIDNNTIIESATILGISPTSKVIYAFVEVNDHHPWSLHVKSLSQKQIHEVIRKVIHSTIHIQRNIYLHEHRNRIGFVLSTEDLAAMNDDLRQFAQQLHIQMSEQLGYPVYIYMGSPVMSIIELSKAYQTAKDAIQYKFLEEDCMYVIHEDVQHLILNYLDMDNQIYDQLYIYIEEFNEKAIHETIRLIFQEFRVKKFAPEAVKMVINRCVSGIIKIAKQMTIDEKELSKLEPIISWQDLNLSAKELRRLFTDFVMHTSQLVSTVRKDTMKGGIQKIKSYIEAHYQDNISLKSIASEFYMNPVYLGQLFRKTYGVYFNDYLLQIRVNEAKKLLRQTDLRSYEVAEKVGFSNADYFVTQFEKIEHVTPTEYRNKLL